MSLLEKRSALLYILMENGSLTMDEKPDFYQMPRQELRQYVLSHREDDEALRTYMDRMRTEPGVTRIRGTTSEEDMKKLEEYLKSTLDKEKQQKPDTNQPKYDRRGANIGGIVDTAQPGSHPEFYQHNYTAQNLSEASQEIQQLLEQLSRTYPTDSTTEKMIVATKTIEVIENNPTWKQKAVAACQQGLLEAMKTNPIGAFVVGAIEGWEQ
jgi:hypothetical protein